MIKTPSSTVIGGAGIWTPGATIIGASSKNLTQLIKSIFATGEQGFAYDPNDLTTLYQDAAGTIPVTAAGQPVGLMLDKSKGLTFGAEKVINGNFDTNLSGWANTTNSFVWDNGKAVSTGVEGDLTQDAGGVVGKWYKCSFTLSAAVRTGAYVSFCGNDLSYFSRDGSYSIITLCSSPTKFARFRVFTGDSATIDNVSIKELAGNHAYQPVSASRPILQRNATTGAYYLAFDGADDFLQTNSINFTMTDKVSLFAGVRKLSDINAQLLVELSADQTANSGSFVLMPRQTGIAEGASFRSRGSLYNSILNVAGLKAPLSTVFTAKADIQSDSSILRSNGVQVGELNVDQGTGNFGNYPLYIGRRAGTSLPFNGHLYSLIGIGRLTTDSETIELEKAIAKNTGVTLNV